MRCRLEEKLSLERKLERNHKLSTLAYYHTHHLCHMRTIHKCHIPYGSRVLHKYNKCISVEFSPACPAPVGAWVPPSRRRCRRSPNPLTAQLVSLRASQWWRRWPIQCQACLHVAPPRTLSIKEFGITTYQRWGVEAALRDL